MAAALEAYAPECKITIADRDEKILVPKQYSSQIGIEWLTHLKKFDVFIQSPGIPPNVLMHLESSRMTSATQIFFDSIKNSGAVVIGVTGSKGKSTTSTLIHAILQAWHQLPMQASAKTPLSAATAIITARGAAAIRTSQFPDQSAVFEPLLREGESFLVGNIGEPAIAHLKDVKKNTVFVLEMSSYQLMNLKTSPHIAVITTFFPEHLDYHGSLDKYLEAKKHITRFQQANDIVVFNAENQHTVDIAKESAGTKIPFTTKDAPVTLENIQLKGEHNLGNIAAAWKVCEHLGVLKETAIQAIKQCKGLPHRLESLGIHNGIEWVNDSISTTPESAIAALNALGDRVHTVIVGGQDRGYDFSALVKRLQTSSVQTVILLPDSGKTIGDLIEKTTPKTQCFYAETMEQAVCCAKETTHYSLLTTHSPIVLLSPAAPSYGHFINFEDRGNQFRKHATRS